MARTTGTNLLLIGRTTLTEPIIRALWGDAEPSTWRPGRRLSFPIEAELVVLYDVDSLWHAEQVRLSQWLESRIRPAQIVSTTAEPLWARVASEAFLATLYYRLNTICVDLRSDARGTLTTLD